MQLDKTLVAETPADAAERPQTGPGELDVGIGRRVRELRKARGMSQTELGSKLGVTFQQVQKYERGVNRLAGSSLIRAAKALDVPVSALLSGPDEGATEGSGPSPEALLLLQAFERIGQPDMRRQVLAMVEALAREQGRSGPK